MTTAGMTAGFADPVRDAQAAFRALLDAMARPGTVATLPEPAEPPPAPLAAAAATVALALCDADTPIWLDAGLAAGGVPAWLRFHCGAAIVAEAGAAAFVFAGAAPPEMAPPDMAHPDMAPPDMASLDQGSDLFPDRSATLVIGIAALGTGALLRLSGPGIEGAASVRLDGLPQGFVGQRAANRRRYPRGVDCILVSGNQVLCLPRSTIVEAA